jgi:META domain
VRQNSRAPFREAPGIPSIGNGSASASVILGVVRVTRVFSICCALVLLVASCSSGGEKHSAPTSQSPTTESSAASLVVADPAPCSTSTPVSKRTLKTGALHSKMVPFTAVKVQVCRYPVGVQVVGKLLTTASSVRQLENATNRLPIPPTARGHHPGGKSCRMRGSWYFLTFVSESQRVDVSTDSCSDRVGNGVLSARSTPAWLNELQRYTPVAIIGTWRPVSIAGYHGPLTDPPLAAAPILRFDGGGGWTGNDSCNNFGGSYQLKHDGTFHLIEQGSTKVGCRRKTPGPPISAVRADISQGRLTFFGRDGRQVAEYQRVGEGPVHFSAKRIR